jgi:protein-S-isoprenylcysteine O-methyltransferase Ste14
MKLLTFLSALIYGLLILFIFPILFINLNSLLSLPVFLIPLLKLIGIFLVLIGGSIWLYCTGMFYFIGKGTPVPIDPPKHLVIKGIYKRTRNPMYLSVLIIIFGYFLFFGHLALLMYLASLAGFFHLFVVLYEEPTLKKKFGKSYFRYLKEAPRWI